MINVHRRMVMQQNRIATTWYRRSPRRTGPTAEQARWKEAKLWGALEAVVTVTGIKPVPQSYKRGCAMFFPANWTSPDGASYLALKCDSMVNRKPVAALLWRSGGSQLETVDLSSVSFEDCVRLGRLFIFPATTDTPNGMPIALQPADFESGIGDSLGHWAFANAGTWRGRPFYIGPSGLGSFTDSPTVTSRVALARPNRFSQKLSSWLWLGRSTAIAGQRLVFPVANFPLGQTRFDAALSPLEPGGQIAGLRCDMDDDNGDPLAALETLPPNNREVREIEGRLFFSGYPNAVDKLGRPFFSEICKQAADGTMVLSLEAYTSQGVADIELPANFVDKDKGSWFVRYPNAKRVSNGQPMVFLPLSTSGT